MERFGPDLSLPELVHKLAPDCLTRGQPGIESCNAIYPALAAALRASLVESPLTSAGRIVTLGAPPPVR